MFEFHRNRRRYFEMQILNTKEYLIPFIEQKFSVNHGMRVLEIGCGEGGVLKAFIDRGCVGVGVELDEARITDAEKWLEEDMAQNKITFINKDIYAADAEKDFNGGFDIIVLKDVIEHIHDQKKLIGWMKSYLHPNGVIFFGFPPWQMPFGGHQQMCGNKVLATLPYYHLLPKAIYKWILKKAGEPWEALLEIKETGISIERFERIVKECNYEIINKLHYLVNPIYKYKFGWQPKEQIGLIKALPYVRDYFTTCVYYLVQPKKDS